MIAFEYEFLNSVTQIERKFGLLRLAHVTYRRKAALRGTCCQDREIHFLRTRRKIWKFFSSYKESIFRLQVVHLSFNPKISRNSF